MGPSRGAGACVGFCNWAGDAIAAAEVHCAASSTQSLRCGNVDREALPVAVAQFHERGLASLDDAHGREALRRQCLSRTFSRQVAELATAPTSGPTEGTTQGGA
jgi:hypothetical protein